MPGAQQHTTSEDAGEFRIMKHKETGSVPLLFACFVLLAMVGAAFVWGASTATSGVKQSRYLVPQGYTGWVRIYFDIEGAPAAERQGDAIIYRVPANGRLLTSTPNDESNGSDMRFFYYDGQNETEIDGRTKGNVELVHGFVTAKKGTFTSIPTSETTGILEPGPMTHYDQFFVGTREQYEAVTGKTPGEYSEIEDAEKLEFERELLKYRTKNISTPSRSKRRN